MHDINANTNTTTAIAIGGHRYHEAIPSYIHKRNLYFSKIEKKSPDSGDLKWTCFSWSAVSLK